MPSWHVQFYGDDGKPIGDPQPYDERSGLTDIPEGAAKVRHYFHVPPAISTAELSCMGASTQVSSPRYDPRRPKVFGFGSPQQIEIIPLEPKRRP